MPNDLSVYHVVHMPDATIPRSHKPSPRSHLPCTNRQGNGWSTFNFIILITIYHLTITLIFTFFSVSPALKIEKKTNEIKWKKVLILISYQLGRP